MKIIAAQILLLLLPHLLFSQECSCPRRYAVDGYGAKHNLSTPAKIYSFTNNQKIALCGYADVEDNDTAYAEIALYICGQNKPIQQWGAATDCTVQQIGDTLVVAEIDQLPIGRNDTFISLPFYIHKFFFSGAPIQETAYYRTDIKKYSKAQIKDVLDQYKYLTKGNYEHTVDVARLLFWAYVSGSREAELYLKEIPNKCGPFDGVVAEEWADIWATFQRWKEKSNITNSGVGLH